MSSPAKGNKRKKKKICSLHFSRHALAIFILVCSFCSWEWCGFGAIKRQNDNFIKALVNTPIAANESWHLHTLCQLQCLFIFWKSTRNNCFEMSVVLTHTHTHECLTLCFLSSFVSHFSFYPLFCFICRFLHFGFLKSHRLTIFIRFIFKLEALDFKWKCV